ncbi:aminoglycoside phosphotransferase family protein [Planococcus donghaensis]|uniref:aminoglycoside phosphotransferase family protein n=1 Tax=Planococcus donghaensis TaxID=414778 RepID=UPI001EE2C68E|nr:aminoglycoside phosphotransferase family protein [Planococcus donghaensis]
MKIPYTKLKYQRELDAYKLLAGKVPVPQMLDYWSGDSECPGAFLLSELKGKPLTTDVSSEVAFQVGILHAQMHAVCPPVGQETTSIENEFSNWLNFIESKFLDFAVDVKEIIETELYEKSMNKFSELKQQLPAPVGPSFIHMDFRPANIIVDGKKVSGVIDFESVRFGSIDIDFTKLYRDFLSVNDSFYQAYQDGYRTIKPLLDLKKVLLFYQFLDAFNSIGWCRRRGLEKNAAFLEENLVILKKIVNG